MDGKQFVEKYLSRVLVLDGATGTELAKRGLPPGVCPETWVLEHPDAINAVQSAYENAGSSIVYTPTFGGNRIKLSEYGIADRCAEINAKLAQIARKGIKNALVFGDIAPTGKFIEPFGDFAFEEAVSVYKEQACALLEGGVQGFAIETMMDLQEARAALIAIRELCDLPVIATMTFGDGNRTLTGNSPASAAIALEALGATAVGCNCSAGPLQMAGMVAEMRAHVRIPIVAKPNAGMPRFDNGRTVFDMGPEEFGEVASRLVAAGASIVGGCCGTTPEHIRCLAEKVKMLSLPHPSCIDKVFISSAREIVEIGQACPFGIIGERLNPTGKKSLQAELRAGKFDLIRKYAREQADAGASILDVNCGLPGIDEAAVLRQSVSILASESSLPLCIDTTNPEAAEAALRLYPGRALFNSISAEKSRLEKVLPIAAKYGAQIIALPLDENGIPSTVEERIDKISQIIASAEKFGFRRADIIVDGLVMTVSANPEAAELTLDTIEWCSSKLNLCTVCGLSNVSFGLPRRDLVNRAFLGAAIGRGLNLAIANPMNEDIMDMVRASDVLFRRDAQAGNFISHYGNTTQAPAQPAQTSPKSDSETAFASLIAGDTNAMLAAVRHLLEDGQKAGDIVNSVLIPAITAVGEKYEKHEFFLPQLMAGAKAMKAGMEYLEPSLQTSGTQVQKCGKVVIATVEGDIHDIGKNIVTMMLKNYNFDVIDLGKDVPADKILDAAYESGASVVGLSALMTTTMSQMGKVVALAHERGMKLDFIVGGAVVDQTFADSIGAKYASDAMATVRLALELTNNN